MKVLLYSHCFYPSIGGLETVSSTLAQGFYQNHIDIKVVTATSSTGVKHFPFEVIRKPGTKQQVALIKWADIVVFNGASLALQPWVLIFRKPFVWIHTGYQVSCIDGLGWVNGKPAPLKPLASFVYHKRLKGFTSVVKEGMKLLVRRFFAKHLVTKNVAITKWMYKVQPLPRQVQIYNPFCLDQFFTSDMCEPEYDFVYVGRLVGEKGVSTLLKAFAKVYAIFKQSPSLLIIGDGAHREKMQQLSNDLKLSEAVQFVGSKTGKELVHFISKAQIAVVPSEWYEPMGGVALELMASGKNLIVSEYGGLKECVGDAGLSFPNGNPEALANCMIRLQGDKSLRKEQLLKGKERIKSFDPALSVQQYINLLKSLS